jgi:ribonuclease HII
MDMETFQMGIDEVGRGALAGPVVVGVAYAASQDIEAIRRACAEVLRKDLTDSKKLTHNQREKIMRILPSLPVRISIGEAPATMIDQQGIQAAVRYAQVQAVTALGEISQNLIIICDAGLRKPDIQSAKFICEPKADERYAVVSLASIAAKEYRDELMRLLPDPSGYGFASNVGYASPQHQTVLRAQGTGSEHRISFCTRLVDVD